MSPRTLKAHAYRAEVYTLFGGKCVRCPAITDLQVHMLVSDGGAHHKFGSDRRWKYYLDAANAGKCELLCRRCHQREEQAIARRRRQVAVFW